MSGSNGSGGPTDPLFAAIEAQKARLEQRARDLAAAMVDPRVAREKQIAEDAKRKNEEAMKKMSGEAKK